MAQERLENPLVGQLVQTASVILSDTLLFKQYPLLVPLNSTVNPPLTTPKLLTVLGEIHKPEQVVCAAGSITPFRYLGELVARTPGRGLNGTVLYLEYKATGIVGEYEIDSKNLNDFLRLPEGVMVKRFIDWRRVMLLPEWVDWLYSGSLTATPEQLAQENPLKIAAFLVETFVVVGPTGELVYTKPAYDLLNMPINGPNEEIKERIRGHREFLENQAEKLVGMVGGSIDQKFLKFLREFWAHVMDHYMILTIAADMTNHNFLQFVVLVGANHLQVFNYIFSDDSAPIMAEDECLNISGTYMITETR